jgi:hypothetical protein
VSHKLVGRLLVRLGFSLQANRKTREGGNHPDRDAQFELIEGGSGTGAGARLQDPRTGPGRDGIGLACGFAAERWDRAIAPITASAIGTLVLYPSFVIIRWGLDRAGGGDR